MSKQSRIDRNLRDSFETLLARCDRYLQARSGNPDPPLAYSLTSDYEMLLDGSSRLIGLLEGGYGAEEHMVGYVETLKELHGQDHAVRVIRGRLESALLKFQNGLFYGVFDQIAYDVSADYLQQAEDLVESAGSIKDDYGPHIPAAAVVGAVLEHLLRRLCERQTPPISLDFDSGGKKKKKLLDRLITDLQTNEAITLSKANQLRSFAQLRNSADHANWEEVPPDEVKRMIRDVMIFLEDMYK